MLAGKWYKDDASSLFQPQPVRYENGGEEEE